MAQIKNLHLLTDELKQSDLDKMEVAATMHKRHSNITFKILELDKNKIAIRAVQDKNSAGNYFDQKRLIEIVHETFDRFFPGRRVLVRALPFQDAKCNEVDDKWIRGQMERTGTRLKDIASETGIDYTQLSSLVNGDRPLSQPMRALFWYYFLNKSK